MASGLFSVSEEEERGRAGRGRGHDTAAEGEVMRICVPIKMPLNAPLSDCRKHPSAQLNTRCTYNRKSRQNLCKIPPDASETLCGFEPVAVCFWENMIS